jgi:transcriptional regulator with XRE-family HTH domain
MPGTVIRKYREMRNYSQKYVASQLGISQNAYSKIENNITQLTVHHVKQLAQILELPITDLLKDEFEIHRPMTVPHTVSSRPAQADGSPTAKGRNNACFPASEPCGGHVSSNGSRDHY